MNPWTAGIDAYTEAVRNATRMLNLPDAADTYREIQKDPDPHATEYDVVRSHPDYELLHFEPEEDEADPILLVYSLINQSYVMDLQEDTSIVQSLTGEGHPVYLTHWKEPGTGAGELTTHDYVNRYIDDCVDTVRNREDEDAVNVLGYCMGGTMSAMYAALQPDKVKNLGTLAATFSGDCDDAQLNQLLETYDMDPQKIVDANNGVAPSEFFEHGFASMDPVHNYVTNFVRAWDNLDDDEFVEDWSTMERWKTNGIDVPGQPYVQFVEDIYMEDKLMQNEMTIEDPATGDSHRIELNDIDMPFLQILADYDHLVAPETSKPFSEAVASEDTEIMSYPTGHVGLASSSRTHEELWPAVAEWFADRS